MAWVLFQDWRSNHPDPAIGRVDDAELGRWAERGAWLAGPRTGMVANRISLLDAPRMLLRSLAHLAHQFRSQTIQVWRPVA